MRPGVAQSPVVAADRGRGLASLYATIGQQGVLSRRRDAPASSGLGVGARPGPAWVGQGTAFASASKRRRGTMLVVWELGQDAPWIVLTDLGVDQAGVAWYGLRCWIELGFRALKSVGWQWQRTRRTDPQRIARHWLVLAVATRWTLAYGARAEDAAHLGIAPGRLRSPARVAQSRQWDAKPTAQRPISVLRLGLTWLNRLLHQGRLWRCVWLRPEPCPNHRPTCSLATIAHLETINTYPCQPAGGDGQHDFRAFSHSRPLSARRGRWDFLDD